jgi:hypothetical protein
MTVDACGAASEMREGRFVSWPRHLGQIAPPGVVPGQALIESGGVERE